MNKADAVNAKPQCDMTDDFDGDLLAKIELSNAILEWDGDTDITVDLSRWGLRDSEGSN